MKKTDLLVGILIGIVASFIGTFLFLTIFTDFGYVEGITIMKEKGQLGKIITLGTILNLIVFFVLLQRKKEIMARGVLLATILLAAATIVL
jgi:mannose/fructose/N-acetylgalactosamine-specific phosphotransferase system component IID